MSFQAENGGLWLMAKGMPSLDMAKPDIICPF
jgi:hypothetical protein